VSARSSGIYGAEPVSRVESPWTGTRGRAVPPPLVGRLALELLFIVIRPLVAPVVLEKPRAHGCFDGAWLDRPHRHQHIIKLGCFHIAWRLRIDRPCDVGRRAFRRKLSAREMLNARLARRANFMTPF
jgi:hypothetical protein